MTSLFALLAIRISFWKSWSKLPSQSSTTTSALLWPASLSACSSLFTSKRKNTATVRDRLSRSRPSTRTLTSQWTNKVPFALQRLLPRVCSSCLMRNSISKTVPSTYLETWPANTSKSKKRISTWSWVHSSVHVTTLLSATSHLKMIKTILSFLLRIVFRRPLEI